MASPSPSPCPRFRDGNGSGRMVATSHYPSIHPLATLYNSIFPIAIALHLFLCKLQNISIFRFSATNYEISAQLSSVQFSPTPIGMCLCCLAALGGFRFQFRFDFDFGAQLGLISTATTAIQYLCQLPTRLVKNGMPGMPIAMPLNK